MIHGINIEFFDLVMESYEDALIACGPLVGDKTSLWREMIEKVKEIKPSYLILVGDVFTKFNLSIMKVYEEFLNSLSRL